MESLKIKRQHALGPNSRLVMRIEEAVDDDGTDNVFREAVDRFAEIEEDEAPIHLLVPKYPGRSSIRAIPLDTAGQQVTSDPPRFDRESPVSRISGEYHWQSR